MPIIKKTLSNTNYLTKIVQFDQIYYLFKFVVIFRKHLVCIYIYIIHTHTHTHIFYMRHVYVYIFFFTTLVSNSGKFAYLVHCSSFLLYFFITVP